jgi:hypothetical protein
MVMTPGSHVYVFRPGVMGRGLPRWQFDLALSGRWGVIVTRGIPGMHWRHAVAKSYEGVLPAELAERCFSGIMAFPDLQPGECLGDDALWSDGSERGNGITRDRLTNTLCLTFGVMTGGGVFTTYYAVRETSMVLQEADFFRLIAAELRTRAEDLP